MRYYAIIDVETTGALPTGERITEIAVYLHDGQHIVDRFESLVNPHCAIPLFIQRLTGISDQMVKDAPGFAEIAHEIERLTQNAVFVAHNVGFDFGMVCKEFERLGLPFNRSRLCTVQLSRKLLPGQPSYSLGKLARSLGIPLNGRHRAAGDAHATVLLFEQILAADHTNHIKNILNYGISLEAIHQDLNTGMLNTIPHTPGIYFFYDKDDQVLFHGISKNMHNQILHHLNHPQSNQAKRLRQQIVNIDFEETGSLLIAQLMLVEAQSETLPPFNTGMRKPTFKHGISLAYDERGYAALSVSDIRSGVAIHASYPNQPAAEKALKKLIKEFNICPHLCPQSLPVKHQELCLHQLAGKCMGGCSMKIKPDPYNRVVKTALTELRKRQEDFLVIDTGRHKKEHSLVLVEKGEYVGFGYIDANDPMNIGHLKTHISSRPETRFIRQRIQKYLAHHPVKQIVYFSCHNEPGT